MKFFEELDKEKKERQTREIKDREIQLTKGYWSYNEKLDEDLWVKPKKNRYFLTRGINYHEKIYTVVLSKKPLDLNSEPFDYPWEVESFLSLILPSYRESGFTIEVIRKAPIIIVDSDICCPFCLNSSAYEEWVKNSYKQEMLKIPNHLKDVRDKSVYKNNLTIFDIETEKYWCPICNNGTEDSDLLLTKGNEWKAEFINKKELKHYPSPYMEKIREKILGEVRNNSVEYRERIFAEPRYTIKDPLSLISIDKYQGLAVKGVQSIPLNKGSVLIPKWLPAKEKLPENFKCDPTPFTSYMVQTKFPNMPKRDKNRCSIIYIPLNELKISYYTGSRDEERVKKALIEFHGGDLLDPVRVMEDNYILNNRHLAWLAYDIGLTHLPVMIRRTVDEDIKLESRYKDYVQIIEEENKPMIPYAQPTGYGTFIKKDNRIYRTEAYIQWGASDEIIGSVIMLNPGRAGLENGSIEEGNPINHKLILDPTMKALVELVTTFNDDSEGLKGRLYIYNLFPLKSPRSSNAIKEFENLWLANEEMVRSLPKSEEELLSHFKQSPWVLLGWGCNNNSPTLNTLKSKWVNIIKQTNTPILGKVGKSNMDYYHPRPQLVTQQIKYREVLKQQYDVFKKK